MTATWQTADAHIGPAHTVPLTHDSGLLWFFDAANIELVVKVLDACGGARPRFWVFAAGLTNVQVDLRVEDTVSGAVRRYDSALGQPFRPLQDTDALPCDELPTSIALVGDAAGKDWSLPASPLPAANSGFFSEERAPAFHVDTRSVDLTWRQLEPTKGVFSTTTRDHVYGMAFGSWAEQLAGSDPYWLRLWVSGVDWAPAWAQQECGVAAVGVGYENDPHLPIWNACLWGLARDLYRRVLIDHDLRRDPRLRFAYVPGAFTWGEFDLDVPSQAADAGLLSFSQFDTWFQGAMTDLVTIMDGDNATPDDDFAWKLVFTGEDYPFSPWGRRDDLLARDAVARGMGIRNGITEVSNFHLAALPAYGISIGGDGIAADGHLVIDENWPLRDGKRVIGTENECFDDCGFHTKNRAYAVEMANLKALQMRVNWLYVVPGPSYMAAYPELYAWVRLSLGQTAASAADAWVALREAEDRYWLDDDAVDWAGKPWIKNLERFLVQVEPPGAVTRRGTDMHVGELSPDNGTAYEGRRTDRAHGSDRIALAVDDRFLAGPVAAVDVKVTYLDTGTGDFWITAPSAGGVVAGPRVARHGSDTLRTATFRLAGVRFDGSFAGGADLAIRTAGPDDLEVRFVRLVRVDG